MSIKTTDIVDRIKKLVKVRPVLISQIGGFFPNIEIADLYELVWELERQGLLICLDFESFELSDTFCFAADTRIFQPGIKTLFYYEKDFLNAMLAKKIISDEDLNILSEDHKILLIRSLFSEMASSGLPPTKEFVRTAINKFLTREQPWSGINEL